MVEYLPHMHKNDLGFILQDYKKKSKEGRKEEGRKRGKERCRKG